MTPPTVRHQGPLLAGTLATAVAVTAAVTWMVLVVDPSAGLSEGLRTGGLAGASVVALYGLWLNDRRRRLEEARQQVEEARLRLETDRAVDERFARSAEMLGNEADQVRVGAMHALAGLARGAPAYTQTVVDVLCAYLRRPFHHRAYEHVEFDSDRSDFADPSGGRPSTEDAADDRERQVRLTAQRVLLGLLPPADDDGPAYVLDLTGASLEFLDLTQRSIGGLVGRRAVFHGITRLSSTVFTGRVLLTGSVFRGRVELDRTRFAEGVSLQGARMHGEVDLSDARVADFADLRWLEPADVDLTGTTATDTARLRLPPGIALPRRS